MPCPEAKPYLCKLALGRSGGRRGKKGYRMRPAQVADAIAIIEALHAENGELQRALTLAQHELARTVVALALVLGRRERRDTGEDTKVWRVR